MRSMRELWKTRDKRLTVAMACYALLGAIAAIALDGILRLLMLAFFTLLALKSLHAPRMDE